MKKEKMMMKKILTEVRPSSGADSHEHKFQVLEGGTQDPTKIALVCTVDGCTATKLVNKPKVQESKGEKPLLLG
jgi:hypothetical protein